VPLHVAGVLVVEYVGGVEQVVFEPWPVAAAVLVSQLAPA
jgi:hypothetical protein